MRGRLVLFDIDGTLVDTRGAGLEAIRRAAAELHEAAIPELDLRGATDAGVVREVLQACGVQVTAHSVDEFFATYLQRLAEHLADRRFPGEVLPGVRELLDILVEAEAVLGLLTGNVEEGARLKLGRFELDHYFAFGAYGRDHVDRTELGPLALARAEARHARTFAAEETVIVGDTPRDIACGKSLGAVTLAVATGGFTTEQLAACEPDLVVETFAEVREILTFLAD